jgi:DNA-directed RNA polymerase specialized sigma24 family protein
MDRGRRVGVGGSVGARHRYAVVDALNAEWERLAVEHRDTIRAWAAWHDELAGCQRVHDVVERIAASPDSVLAVLIMRCATGEQLAGQVVLQAMLGKVVRMAARDPQAGVDDYVAAMWIRIQTYPLADRPHKIAANLALDTLKSVKRETRWLRRGEVTPYPPDLFVAGVFERGLSEPPRADGQGDAELSAQTIISAARRLGLVDGPTGEVLMSVYDEGLSGRLAAERHGTSPGMVRYRCSQAVRRLAMHTDELMGAA